MSHTNHRRGEDDVKHYARRRPHGCCDEGANGSRGRTDWKRLSHRAARRNAKQGNDHSKIAKFPKNHNRGMSPVLKNPMRDE